MKNKKYMAFFIGALIVLCGAVMLLNKNIVSADSVVTNNGYSITKEDYKGLQKFFVGSNNYVRSCNTETGDCYEAYKDDSGEIKIVSYYNLFK